MMGRCLINGQEERNELHVPYMIGKRKVLNQIAEEFHVSANTVRTYRTRILEKADVKGTSEFIQ